MQDIDYSFLGVGWGFPVKFDAEKGSVVTVGGVSDIEESLKILFATLPGERVTLLRYGCRIRDIIFSPVDSRFPILAQEAITDAIEAFEPRIEVINVVLQNDEEQQGVVHLHLDYSVKMTNSRYNLVYPFAELEANV